MNWYCDAAKDNPYHQPYHDNEYGFVTTSDRVLFERLCLEIFQAGLSWLTVLKKRDAFNRAFNNFDAEKIRHYDQEKVAELLQNKDIIRNRLKISSIIHNAAVFADLSKEYNGFDNWLAAHHPRKHKEWVKLFKKTFKFTGPEIVKEFLMGIGYLDGAHRKDCPIYAKIAAQNPPFLNNG